MSKLLSQLRDATNEIHESLHVHPLLAPLQSQTITHADYAACLQAFHAAHSEMQRALQTTAVTALPMMQWLEKDMQAHDVAPLMLPAMPYPPIDNHSRYMGYMYVVFGSLLGGRVISRHLHRNLGLIEGHNNHFFAGLGEETGTHWKAFVSLLDNPEIDAGQAVEQAMQTFRLVAHYCDAVLAARQENR